MERVNGNPVRDWIYPDHALVGSIRGILMQYISDKSSYFTTVQWFIKNHIKLMHCYGKSLDDLQYIVGNNPPSQYHNEYLRSRYKGSEAYFRKAAG